MRQKMKNKKIIILNDTSSEPHHGCWLVMENIRKLAIKNGMEIIFTCPSGLDWKKNKDILDNIHKCDLVLVNGEGTLHHAQPVARDLITIGKYVKQNFNIPVVLMNSTYQDNGDEFAEYAKYFDLIFVRETLSQDDLINYGIASRVVPDMTFYTKFNLLKKAHKNLIGVTDSLNANESMELLELALNLKYEYLPILSFPKIKKNIRGVLSFSRFLFFRKIKGILLWTGFKFSHKITKMFYYSLSYEDYINKIADLDFLIVARYHTLCFSLKTLTPFFSLELNSFKMKGLLQDVGISKSRIVTLRNLDELSLKEFNQNEKSKISSYVNDAPSRIELMFKEIKELTYIANR